MRPYSYSVNSGGYGYPHETLLRVTRISPPEATGNVSHAVTLNIARIAGVPDPHNERANATITIEGGTDNVARSNVYQGHAGLSAVEAKLAIADFLATHTPSEDLMPPSGRSKGLARLEQDVQAEIDAAEAEAYAEKAQREYVAQRRLQLDLAVSGLAGACGAQPTNANRPD